MVGTVEVDAATDTTPTVTPTPGGPTPTPGSFGVAQRTIGTRGAQAARDGAQPPARGADGGAAAADPHADADGPRAATPTPTPTAQAAQTVHVTVGNDFFRDASSGNSTTTIPAGTTVEWDWTTGPHTTTSGTAACGDGNWNSRHEFRRHFTHTFTTAGDVPLLLCVFTCR